MCCNRLIKLDAVNHSRSQAIGNLIGQLHLLLDKYRSSAYECPNDKLQSLQCGCILLGALTRELSRLKMLSPGPTKPFLLLSFNSLCASVKTIQSPTWIYQPKLPFHSGLPRVVPHECSLQNVVAGIVAASASTLTGLDLKETKGVKSGFFGLFQPL
jgi:hypothetical protein